MENLLTTKEAAEWLNVSEEWLERDRWSGAKIPFIKVGARAVRYDPEVIKKYLLERTRVSTSQVPQGVRKGITPVRSRQEWMQFYERLTPDEVDAVFAFCGYEVSPTGELSKLARVQSGEKGELAARGESGDPP